MSLKRNFPCKKEELPEIANLLKNSLENDLNNFSDINPKFNAKYIEDFGKLIEKARAIPSPTKLTLERQKAGQVLHEKLVDFKELAHRINYYITQSHHELSENSKKFTFSKLYKNISIKNSEAVLASGEELAKLLKDDVNKLKKHGFKGEFVEELNRILGEIKKYHDVQSEKLSERSKLVSSNMNLLNELWSKMTEIILIAKLIYSKDGSKIKNYTFSVIKKNLNPKEKFKPKQQVLQKTT